jgi:hypothetical protein
VTIERGLWMSFFTDVTNAEIALRRAVTIRRRRPRDCSET